MTSAKRLRSVCHSIAHHAVSGLSYIHPHLLEAARSAGVAQIEVQLLETDPCPERFRSNEPLRKSLKTLKDKFEAILKSEGFSLSDLAHAKLSFTADPAQNDNHCSICRANLSPLKGESVEYVVNYMGQRVGA